MRVSTSRRGLWCAVLAWVVFGVLVPAPVKVRGSRAQAAAQFSASRQPPRSRAPLASSRGVPPLRVRLTTGSTRTITVAVDGPFRIQSREGALLLQGSRLPATSVQATPKGFRLGRQILAADSLDLLAIEQPSLWVNDHQYRGNLRVERRAGQTLQAINLVDLEDYLASVINGEMPDDFPPSARRAQAIVARTYAVYQAKTFGQAARYDLTAGTGSQLYQGVQYRTSKNQRLAVETASSRRVIEETRGIVMSYHGKLFCTYYSAICGGRTTVGRSIFSDASAVLVSVPCDWCAGSKYYRWKSEISKRELETRLQRHFAEQGRAWKDLQSLSVVAPPRAGLAPRVRVVSSGSATEISAYVFRLLAGPNLVRSPYFQVYDQGAQMQFVGRGWGHGVGLCQWGARGQALAGRSAMEILQYYYPHSELIAIR